MTNKERLLLDRMVAAMDEAAPVALDPRDLARDLGVPVQAIQRVTTLGVSSGAIRSAGGLMYPVATLRRMASEARGEYPNGLAIADARDLFGGSRRFADAVLTAWEAMGLASRVGGRVAWDAADWDDEDYYDDDEDEDDE